MKTIKIPPIDLLNSEQPQIWQPWVPADVAAKVKETL